MVLEVLEGSTVVLVARVALVILVIMVLKVVEESCRSYGSTGNW